MEAGFIANYDAGMTTKKPSATAAAASPAPPASAPPSRKKGPGRGRRKRDVVEGPTEETADEGENASPPVVAVLLGRALRDLRLRYAPVQDDFAALVGRSQSYLSNAERGKTGWYSVTQWAEAIGRAGGDPVDLLRLAVAHAEQDPELSEILKLWPRAEPHLRGAILILLRESAQKAEAAARSEAQ